MHKSNRNPIINIQTSKPKEQTMALAHSFSNNSPIIKQTNSTLKLTNPTLKQTNPPQNHSIRTSLKQTKNQQNQPDQQNQQNQQIKQGFVSKYFLCCFSHKYKYARSYIRQPQSKYKDPTHKTQLIKLKPKATKVFDINHQQTQLQLLHLKQVKMPNIPQSTGKFAKSQIYAKESNQMYRQGYNQTQVGRSNIGTESLLDFRLDDNPGVSDTFALPFFDYNGVLQNKYYSKQIIVVQNKNELRSDNLRSL